MSVIAFQFLLMHPSHARLKAIVSYSEFLAKADAVAMIEPIKNEPAKDAYAGNL